MTCTAWAPASNECSGDLVSAAREVGSGIRSVQDADQAARAQQIGSILRSYLDVNQRRASQALHDAVAAIPYTVAADIEQRIGDERKLVEESLARMGSGSTAPKAPDHEVMQRRVEQLNEIQSRLDELEASVL